MTVSETDSALLQRILDASAAALDALDRGDDAAVDAALEERERLQALAAPVLARAARRLRGTPDDGVRDPVQIREMALELAFWNRVLQRRIRRQRDERAAPAAVPIRAVG